MPRALFVPQWNERFYYDIGYGTQVTRPLFHARLMESTPPSSTAEQEHIWPQTLEVQKREIEKHHEQYKEKYNPDSDPAKQRILFRKILDRDHLHYAFNTNAYLQDFYAKVDEPAMQMMLTYLPTIVCRLPKGGKLLDIGAGPTIHVPVAFRNAVDQIYLSDYLTQNRAELMKWYKGESSFNWTKTLAMVSVQESSLGTPFDMEKMQEEARSKVRGILYCDVHDRNILPGYPEGSNDQFSIVTSFFCIEYCCKTEREYRDAIRNCVRTVKPGGYFIMGSVMEENWCAFGGIQFECLYTTESLIRDCLKNAGIDVDAKDFQLYEVNGIYLLYGRKMTRDEYAAQMIGPSEEENEGDEKKKEEITERENEILA